MAPKWKDKNISRGFCGDTMKCRTFTGSGHTKIQSDYFQKTTTTTRLKSIPFIEMWAASAPFVFCVGQLRVQVRSAVALGCRRVLHADLPVLKHLNYPLSVSKATVICHPVILRWMRWLPRLSQPVQRKDRKSQGSTPLTPRPASPTQTWPFTDAPLRSSKTPKLMMRANQTASAYWSSGQQNKHILDWLQVSLRSQTDQLIDKSTNECASKQIYIQVWMDDITFFWRFKYLQSGWSTSS